MNKSINFIIRPFTTVLFVALIFSACSKKDEDEVTLPPVVNEEELITTLTLEFTDTDDKVTSFSFKDPDGDGGNGPTVFDTIRLAKKMTYDVSITLLDESKNPPHNISEEVKEEDDEHLFCFYPNAHVDIIRTDSDGTYEVGLESQWTTNDVTGTGSVTVVLKHQPGVKNGSCDPGETDIEIEFVTVVE